MNWGNLLTQYVKIKFYNTTNAPGSNKRLLALGGECTSGSFCAISICQSSGENDLQNMKTSKKKILFLALILLQVISTHSQNINYGVIIGADVTNMHLTHIPTNQYKNMYSPILSYNINGFVSYKGDFFIGISAEPGIIRKGGVQLFDYLNSRLEPVNKQVVASMTSLQIPILVDFYLNDKIYISAGIEAEYKISEKTVMTNKATTNHVGMGQGYLYIVRGTGPNTNADNIIPDEDYPGFYYSGILGLQYRINERFDAGLRYGVNLKNIYYLVWADANDNFMSSTELYTTYLQLSLKVRL